MLTSHEVFMFGCLAEFIAVVSSDVVCTRVDCLHMQSGTGHGVDGASSCLWSFSR